MSDDKTEQEPSIEEILHSIRQMIFEDGATADTGAAQTVAEPQKPVAAAPPPKPETPKAAPAAVAPPKAPEPPRSAPVSEPPKATAKIIDADDGVLELNDKVAQDPARPRIIMQEVEEMAEEPVPQETNKELLVSDMTAEAAVAAMAKLLSNNLAVERELPGRPGNVTLEDMTRDLMRPLIKTWLDQNLQRIIEKMVAREIERLSLRAMNER